MASLKKVDKGAIEEGRWLVLADGEEAVEVDGKIVTPEIPDGRVRVISARSKRGEALTQQVADVYRKPLREKGQVRKRALSDLAAHTAALLVSEVEHVNTDHGEMTNDFESKFQVFRDRSYQAARDAVLDFSGSDENYRPYEPARDEDALGNSLEPSGTVSEGKRARKRKEAA